MRISKKGIAGAAGLAVATVAAWWVWLGQERTHTTAQVAFCVLTVAVLVAVAVRLVGVHPLPAAGVTTVAFTAAWTVDAAAADGSGLFVIGGFLVLLGCAVGSALVAFLADLGRGERASTR